MYKYILLLLLLSSTVFGQTTGKQLEFNSAWGVDYESNMVKNPSAAKNLNDTLKLGATLSRDTSAGNKIDGKASFLLDAGALNDYLELDLYAPSDEQTSGNCGFKGLFKGDASLYRAQILDGSSNVLAQTVPLTNETGFREFRVWYPCGASGARKVRITQTEAGTAPAINVGKFYYGRMEPGAGTFPNTFTAQVLQAGGIASQSSPALLSGSCVVTDTSLYTCPVVSGLFTVFPYCDVTPYAATSANATAYLVDVSPTQIQVRTYKGGVKDVSEFFLKCRKRGADEIQPAITPDQTDYDWKSYTPTILAASGTFPTYTLNYAEYARFNGKLYVRGKLTFTGTNTWATPVVPIPSGLTHTGARENVPAKVVYGDNGSNTYLGQAALQGGANITLGSMSGTNGAGIGVTQASPFTWASTDTMEWFVGPIDITGWNNVQSTPLLLNTVYADTAVKAEKAAGLTSVDYGTYSATVTNVTNATSITSPATCQYLRLGSTVDVTCSVVSGCTTSGGTSTQMTVTLPVATTQGTTIRGIMGTIVSNENGRIINSGNLALMDFACQATGVGTRYPRFMYQVP